MIAISGAVALKLHFDELLDDVPTIETSAEPAPQSETAPVAQAEETEAASTTTERAIEATNSTIANAGSSLGSSAADPDFTADEVISNSPSDADIDAEPGSPVGERAFGEIDPAGPRTAVGTSVDAIDIEWPFVADEGVWVDAKSSGRPWTDLGAVDGLLTFRGNPTRTFHGRGPLPTNPRVQWFYRVGCSNSPVAGEDKEWCGSGWTGQPAVFQMPATGAWTVAFGAYNRNVNFLNPQSGLISAAPYRTGDIIKGSVTVDPDGFPLLYTGSRDNYFHIVSLDTDRPTALWRLSSETDGPTLWNNDWDGSALVVDDHLFVGGENGRFYIVRLNRGYNDDGTVRVDPEVVFSAASWDGQLLRAIGDQEASIENSVAISGDTVYFTNSGGLVQGWDIAGLSEGETPTQVLRYWTGDDTDATIVIDDEGMLYVASQYQRSNDRSRELGQILKLDPTKPDDPLVWSRQSRAGPGSGVWATPALYEGLLIVATNEGELIGLDRMSGDDRWRLALEGPLWSSPVVVDGTLIQADCGGFLHAFDLGDGSTVPVQRWTVELGGCLESTPAVWDGQIFVGSRSGDFFAVGD